MLISTQCQIKHSLTFMWITPNCFLLSQKKRQLVLVKSIFVGNIIELQKTWLFLDENNQNISLTFITKKE